MKNSVQFPINIAPSQGAYSINLLVGSQQQTVELLIDTGSSTITFKESHYQPHLDQHKKLTAYAQCVTYGKGGWAGPVLKSTITYSNGVDSFDITDAPFALVEDQLTDSFLGLDGIFGLAYHHINRAYDLTDFLKEHDQKAHTYPWQFSQTISEKGIKPFKQFLRNHPEKDVKPIFTAFEEQFVNINMFSLLTHRAIAYVPKHNMSLDDKKKEPLNQGLFIVGHIDHDKNDDDGYSKNIKVLHDAYYNTNLLSVQVEGFESFSAPRLDKKHIKTSFTNAIIDSGSSYLMLQADIYQYILDCFKSINPEFITHISAFNDSQKSGKAYKPDDINLASWPTLYFTFEGSTEPDVTVSCPATHYWQTDAISPNQCFFTLLKQIPHWPDQSVIGLPLMSYYLCIFDRSAGVDGMGVIKFVNKEDVE